MTNFITNVISRWIFLSDKIKIEKMHSQFTVSSVISFPLAYLRLIESRDEKSSTGIEK